MSNSDNLDKKLEDAKVKLDEKIKKVLSPNYIPELINGEHTIVSGTYTINHDIRVENGRLTIEKGTIINFGKDNGLYVGKNETNNSQIIIDGTYEERVILQAKTDTWKGVTIDHTYEDNFMRHTQIKNAEKQKGAGIHALSSQLNLEDILIEKCVAHFHGGGIYAWNSDVRITDAAIRNNRASLGSGIANYKSEVKIIRGTIRDNQAKEKGGAMFNNHAKVSIEGTRIMSNTAPGAGGIYCKDSEILISGISVHHNNSAYGGGFYARGCKLVQLGRNVFENNKPENFCEVYPMK